MKTLEENGNIGREWNRMKTLEENGNIGREWNHNSHILNAVANALWRENVFQPDDAQWVLCQCGALRGEGAWLILHTHTRCNAYTNQLFIFITQTLNKQRTFDAVHKSVNHAWSINRRNVQTNLRQIYNMTLASKRWRYAGLEYYSNRAFPDVRRYVGSSL